MTLATSTIDNIHHYSIALEDSVAMSNHPLKHISSGLNKQFDAAKWPTIKHEEWKYTSLKQLNQIAFSLEAEANLDRAKAYLESLPFYHLPNSQLVFINGKFNPELSKNNTQEKGFIGSLYQHADLIPQQVSSGLGISKPSERDELRKLNNLALHDGMSIHLLKGAVSDSVYVYHIIDAELPLMVHPRNLIQLSENAQCKIVEHYASFGHADHWFNPTTEVFLNADARLDYCLLQTQKSDLFFTGFTYLQQTDRSSVNHHTLTTGGRLVRNNLDLVLDGSHIESHMNGLYMITGSSLVDNHTLVDHRKPHSQSNEFYKGIMDGKSTGVFNGKIFVRQQAQKTNAFQSNRNIVLSPEASINTKPQLEIFADDVKCSHGATSGQLDEESIFYLRSRGLNTAQAKALLMKAFAGEIVDRVSQPEVRAYVEQQIDQRF